MSGENNNNQEEFSFIREKIKEKPLNKKKLAIKVLSFLFGSIAAGLIITLVFVVSKPVFEELFPKKSEPLTVTIPQDELEEIKEEAEAETEPVTQPAEQILNVVERVELEIDDLNNVYEKLSDLAIEANSSLVSVIGVSSNVDWFNTPYLNTDQSTGLIIANNGRELLILSDYAEIKEVEEINVTFYNSKSAPALLKKYDTSTGIAVLAVDLNAIDESTMNSIQMATLGNSYSVTQGNLVLAVGSPLGFQNSFDYGIITSAKNEADIADISYHVLTTDIIGSSAGSGILMNANSEVVGIIKQKYSMNDENTTITALAISDLKPLIEKLLNYNEMAYLGIKGTDVTTAISEEYGIPKGVYIKNVVMDSPAMNAGIQSGDILIKIDNTEITAMKDYENLLLASEPDQTVKLTVMRQGKDEYKEIEFEVTLGLLE